MSRIDLSVLTKWQQFCSNRSHQKRHIAALKVGTTNGSVKKGIAYDGVARPSERHVARTMTGRVKHVEGLITEFNRVALGQESGDLRWGICLHSQEIGYLLKVLDHLPVIRVDGEGCPCC